MGADISARRHAVGGALGGLGANVAEECLVEGATGQTLTRQGHVVLALGSPGRGWRSLAQTPVIRWGYVDVLGRAFSPTIMPLVDVDQAEELRRVTVTSFVDLPPA
jgi:hypothetical protein